MKNNFTVEQIKQEISEAETKLKKIDIHGFKLWEQVMVSPSLWKQNQYSIDSTFWVVAILGKQCLYFNFVEGGWGWGEYEEWGEICSFHCQQNEIQDIILYTVDMLNEVNDG